MSINASSESIKYQRLSVLFLLCPLRTAFKKSKVHCLSTVCPDVNGDLQNGQTGQMV